MKKLFGLTIAAALTFCALAGQAMAAFTTNYELIRVVYDKTTAVEVATDLGYLPDLITAMNANGGTLTVGGGASAFNLNDLSYFGTGAAYSDLKVAYFAVDPTATSKVYVSASSTPTTGTSKWGAARSAFTSVRSYYNAAEVLGGTTVKGVTTAANCYYVKLDSNMAALEGTWDQLITAKLGESVLTALASGGSVSQTLYYFASPNQTGAQGVATLTLITNADGSTTLQALASTVPVPPAALLLAPGLLGLIGIRRRILGA
jgi:hypothetical protein